MSDSKKFGFLKGKAAQAEQFGRRADPTYSQVNANIPADLRRRFRAELAIQDRKMQEVLELLIEGYLEGRFKV